MFRETLIESAPSIYKRKRWPMALAFTAEMIVATLLVAIPLLSTGVISVSAHIPLVLPPVKSVRVVERVSHNAAPSGGGPTAHARVVSLNNNRSTLTFWNAEPRADDTSDSGPNFNVGPTGFPNLPAGCDGCRAPVRQGSDRVTRVSIVAEGQLLNRVDPVYPRPAAMTGVQGAVRLHAVIARDGSIQSLSVISGHPLLVGAALDAVRQWRYRPYYLNGEAVEVETFITVNFKKTND